MTIDWNELRVASDWYRERGNDLYADILEECANREMVFNGHANAWIPFPDGIHGMVGFNGQFSHVFSDRVSRALWWAADQSRGDEKTITFEIWRDHFSPPEYDCEDCEDSGEVDCSECRGTGEGWPGGSRCGWCRGGLVECGCQKASRETEELEFRRGR